MSYWTERPVTFAAYFPRWVDVRRRAARQVPISEDWSEWRRVSITKGLPLISLAELQWSDK